jgi:hypothetical protein
MCCMMPYVDEVSNTNLFARPTEKGQLLVYQMTFEAKNQVAMVLPIPVALPTQENIVRFIDMKGYPEFFQHLNAAFPLPESPGCAKTLSANAADAVPMLTVESVGDFIASFVPSPKDFRRLDPRFRLPEGTFRAMPLYNDYGFVVFQFRKQGGTPHPMAFEFPTRLVNKLFYPTMHIHDGRIHDKENFDHTLYLQDGGYHGDGSKGNAEQYLDMTKVQGIVRGDAPVRRVKMEGMLPNTDTVLDTMRTDPGRVAWITAGLGAALLGGYLYQKRRER